MPLTYLLSRANLVINTEAGVGFNALTEEYIDMVKAGIVDPAKVTRSALQNAASIASLVLTTETIVADKVEENAAVPAMPPIGGIAGTAALTVTFSAS